MQQLFDEGKWLLFNQPFHSPVTNVHDACIFPMMSKQVSNQQALAFGSRIMKGEELNQTVMKVFNNKQQLYSYIAFLGKTLADADIFVENDAQRLHYHIEIPLQCQERQLFVF